MKKGFTERTMEIDESNFFTARELEKLFGYIKGVSLEWFVLFWHLYKSGRRVSELRNLKFKDVIWDENKIVYSILKKHKIDKTTGKFVKRTVIKAIKEDNELMRFLKQYTNSKELVSGIDGEEYLYPIGFASTYIRLSPNKPVSRQQIYNNFIRLCKEAKVHPRHVHALRHTHAREYVRQKGASIQTAFDLSKRLVHSNLDVTMVYLDLTIDEQNEEIIVPSPIPLPELVPENLNNQAADKEQTSDSQEIAIENSPVNNGIDSKGNSDKDSDVEKREDSLGH